MQRDGVQFRSRCGNTVRISDNLNSANPVERQKLVRADSDQPIRHDAVRSEQGHNSIACFRIDQNSGRLTRTAIVPSEPVPRALNVDPLGNFLYAAGLDSGKLAAYKVNESWGGLDRIGTYDVGREPMWVLPVSVGDGQTG